MRTVTLAQLRTDARLYSDQRVADETNAFITAVELNRLINQQLADLYDLLLSARGHDYYATDGTIAVVAGTRAYDLPDDFYQLLAINLEWAADEHEPLDPLNHQQDIWRYNNRDDWQRWTQKAYRLRGEQLDLYPMPRSAVTARVYYVPVCPELADDADTFDGVNGWEKLVALGAAREMLDIEEAGSGARLDERYNEQRDRIQAMADDRDAANEIEIRDAYARPVRQYPPADGTT